MGPARVGAIKSIVAYLKHYPGLGIIAFSMSIIDDVAFIHVQVTADSADRSGLIANARLDKVTIGTANQTRLRLTEPPQLLPEVAHILTGPDRPTPHPTIVADLSKKVGDFHLLVGPARAVPPNLDTRRRALWVSWEVEGRETDLSIPFLALHEVLLQLMPDWGNEETRHDAPNVEYLICRRVRRAVLRGKGKVSFPDRIRLLLGNTNLQVGLSELSERIEEAWRARLDPTHRVRELTVSWRENWLGHWTSPLDYRLHRPSP